LLATFLISSIKDLGEVKVQKLYIADIALLYPIGVSTPNSLLRSKVLDSALSKLGIVFEKQYLNNYLLKLNLQYEISSFHQYHHFLHQQN